ncbi:hypothetical protein [Mitsuokella sp.]
MFRTVQAKNRGRMFVGGMAKAFDFWNTKSLYNRKRSFKAEAMYSQQKTDVERLAEDWSMIGRDMSIAIAEYGETHGQ